MKVDNATTAPQPVSPQHHAVGTKLSPQSPGVSKEPNINNMRSASTTGHLQTTGGVNQAQEYASSSEKNLADLPYEMITKIAGRLGVQNLIPLLGTSTTFRKSFQTIGTNLPEAIQFFQLATTKANTIDDAHTKREALSHIATKLAEAGYYSTAIKTAKTIDDARTKREALHHIATKLAKAGYYSEAIKTANTIGVGDYFDESWALTHIAAEQNKAGFSSGAETTLQLARTALVIADYSDYETASQLIKIAAEQIKADFSSKANTTLQLAIIAANDIDDAIHQSVTLGDLAIELAKAGDYPAAIETASSITIRSGPYDQCRALRGIAAEQARAGFSSEARATFELAIEAAGSFSSSEALRDIATKQAQAGFSSEARATFDLAITAANTIDDANFKYKELMDIATEQAQAGFSSEARATFDLAITAANTIDDADFKYKAPMDIATKQAQAGFSSEARATFQLAISEANTIDSASIKCDALIDIATKQVKAGFSSEAKTTFQLAITAANTIDDASIKYIALKDIATEQANAGDYPAAIETASTIAIATLKIEALSYIATQQAKAGLSSEAYTTLQLAITAANTINDADSKNLALMIIAREQARAGDYPAAIEAATTIYNVSREMLENRHKKMEYIRWETEGNELIEALVAIEKYNNHAQAGCKVLDYIATELVNARRYSEAKINFQRAIQMANDICPISFRVLEMNQESNKLTFFGGIKQKSTMLKFIVDKQLSIAGLLVIEAKSLLSAGEK